MLTDNANIDLSVFDQTVKSEPKSLDLTAFDNAVKKKDTPTSNGTAPNSVNGGQADQSGSQDFLGGISKGFEQLASDAGQQPISLPNSGYIPPIQQKEQNPQKGYQWNPVTPQNNPAPSPTNGSSIGDTKSSVNQQMQEQQAKQQAQAKNNAYWGSVVKNSDILNTDTNNTELVKTKIFDAAFGAQKAVYGQEQFPSKEQVYRLTKNGIDANLAVLQNQIQATPQGQQRNALVDKYNKLYAIGNNLIDDYPDLKDKMVAQDQLDEYYKNLPPVLKQMTELSVSARNGVMDMIGNIAGSEARITGANGEDIGDFKNWLDKAKVGLPSKEGDIADQASIGLGAMIPFLATYAIGAGGISRGLQTAGLSAGTADVAGNIAANLPIQYNQAYTEAENSAPDMSTANKSLYALNSSLLTGMIFSSLPALKTVKGIDEPIAAGAKEYATAIANKASQNEAMTRAMQVAKAGFANIAENVGLMTANDFVQKINNTVANATTGQSNFDPTINPKQELKQVAVNALVMLPFGIIHSAGEFGKQNQLSRESLLYGASNPQQVLPEVAKLKDEGKITQEQFDNTTKLVTSLSGAWEQLPQDMDIKTKEKVLPLVAQRNNLETAGEKLTPVLAKRNEEQIKAIDDKIDKIVNPKTENNALQIESPSSLLQHPQEAVGETGSERSGVEPSVEGEKVAPKSEGKEEVVKPINGIVIHPESMDSKNGIENSNDSDNPERTNDKLSPEGEQEAKKIDLTGHEKIFVSPNERTKQTVELAKKDPNAEIITTPLLKTGDISDYEGTKEENFPERAWLSSKDGNEFKDRMEQTYKLKQDNPDAAFVTHSKVQRALDALAKTDGKWTDETSKDFLAQKEERPEQETPQPNEGAINNQQSLTNENEVKANAKGENAEGSKQAQSPNEENGNKEGLLNKTEKEGEAATSPSESEKTGIKKAVTENIRATRQLPPVEVPKIGTDSERLQQGKEAVDSGKINPKEVVNRINKEGGTYKDAEEANAMQYYMRQLINHESAIRAEMFDANKRLEENPDDIEAAENHILLKQQQWENGDDLIAATEATRKAGTEWSGIGHTMQVMVDDAFSPSRVRSEFKEGYGGEIPKEVNDKLEKAFAERDKALSELDKLRKQRAEKGLKENIEGEIRKAKQERRNIAKGELKAERDDILKSIKDKLKEQRGRLSANPIPVELLPDVAKLVRNYAQEGIINIEDFVDRIHYDLKDLFDGLSKDDVKEVINSAVLQDLKQQAERKEKTLNTKLEKGNLIPKKPVKLPNVPKDNELIKAEQRVKIAEHTIKEQRVKMLNSTRSKTDRFLSWLIRWNRRFVLSGTNVLGKLSASATVGNFVASPIEEVIGSGWSQVFKGIADKAPIEGYMNAKAEGAFFASPLQIKDRWQDLKDIYKTGSTKLTKQYGEKFWEHYAGYDAFLDNHTAIKMFAHQAEYERANIKMTQWVQKHTNLDIGDPLVRDFINLTAFNKANYSIFLNHNKLADSYNSLLKKINEAGQEGRWDKRAAAKTAELVANMMIPVNKVPLNMISRVGVYASGLPRGLIHARDAYKAGIENLTPEEGDLIMQQLKKGSVGTALIVTALLAAKHHFGGLYTPANPDKKRPKGELKSNQVNIGGQNIPTAFQHSVPFQVLQVAGTLGNTLDHYTKDLPKKQRDDIFTAAIKTTIATAGAIAEEAPIINTPVMAGAALMGDRQMQKEMMYRLKNIGTPQIAHDLLPKEKKKK